MQKNNKINIWTLAFTILYVIGFGIYYLITKNYEFLWYIFIMVVLILITIFLNKKFKFNSWILFGMSVWGLMHMAGGSVRIVGTRLYDVILISLVNESVAGAPIFRYDQLAHFYFYFIVTFLVYYILKDYINKNANKFMVSVFLVFIGMGIGALNEIFEFVPVLLFGNTGVGDYFNTLWDIVFNTIGAIVAVIIINLTLKKRN